MNMKNDEPHTNSKWEPNKTGGFMNDGHKGSASAAKDGDRGVGLFDEAKERISDLTEDAKARGEKLIGQVKDRGNEIWEDAQGRGQDAWKDVQTFIQKNPGKCIGYSFLAGAIVSALFLRRKEK